MNTLRLIILIQLLVTAVLHSVCPSESIQFHHPSFSTAADILDIRIVQQDSWYQGQDAVHDKAALWLTPNPQDVRTNKYSNIGKFVYTDLVPFKNTDQNVVSFSTSFTFKIITTGPYGTCGSGMAFFISDIDKAPENSDGDYLGLIDPNAPFNQHKFFAIEFDTSLSFAVNDPSASHIGIDVNSLVSLEYTDTSPESSSTFYPQLHLYNNYTFTAWIEYNSLTNLIQVWMTNSSTSTRPSQACLRASANLSGVFEDFMYVGFSATNKAGEDGMEGHAVYSWSFTSEDSNKSRQAKIFVPVAIAISILFVLGAFGIILFLTKKKREKRMDPVNSTVHTHRGSSTTCLASANSALCRYSYKELKRSARDFSKQSKVGEGGYSSVYKATLADGSVVAIKRLKEGVRKEAEFSAEMSIISSIRHRNLLQLQGWCYEKGEAMLVYKYMTNGSLEGYLYGTKRGELQSDTRLRILVGVASALQYLHGNLGECVLHRDVKAANVLLTEEFEPMLGDFGLACLVGHDEGAITMTVVGTPGYVAPEVVYTGKFTDKADVYSFGVLALEMAYGRPAMLRSSSQSEEGRIADYAWMLHQRDQLVEALDSCMCVDTAQKERWRHALQVALMCCNPLPEARPAMVQVYQALKGDTLLLSQPLPATRPLYPTFLGSMFTSGASSSSTGCCTAKAQSEGWLSSLASK